MSDVAKPEVDLRLFGRHLVKLIWRHNSIGDHAICIKFGRPVQYYMPMIANRSKSKPEVVISRPWIEVSGRIVCR